VLNDRIDYITRAGNRAPIRVVGFFFLKDGKIAEWTDYVVRT
jgi:limonene-1,2-epoxide hydrolase